jgi:hypothetical protein
MSSAESSRMSRKIPSQDLNSELGASIEAYQEAARSDAFLFGEYNAYEAYKMPSNRLTRDEMKCRVLKLKNELYEENTYPSYKDLADKYLNRVLDIIEEYRL